MRLARFTISLAMIWASFRMVADMTRRTVYALLDLTLYLLQIALYALVVTGLGAALYWIAKQAGAPMPF